MKIYAQISNKCHKSYEKKIYKSPWIMSGIFIKGYVTAGRQPPGI